MSSDNVVYADQFTSNKNIVVKKEPLETVLLTDSSRSNNFGDPVIKQTHSPVDCTNNQWIDDRKVCVENRLTQIFPTQAAALTSAASVSLPSEPVLKSELKLPKTSKRYRVGRSECFICGEKFSKRNKLIWHRINVHGYRSETCKDCGEKVTNKKKLRTHLRVHHPERLVTCDVCGLGFVETNDLRKHYSNVHQGQIHRNWYVPTFENSASGSNSIENEIPRGPTVKAEITDVCDSKNTSYDTISCNEGSKFQCIKAEPIDKSDQKNTKFGIL